MGSPQIELVNYNVQLILATPVLEKVLGSYKKIRGVQHFLFLGQNVDLVWKSGT